LLQHLGRIAPEQRARVAEKALQALLPEHRESHDEMAAKAMRLLANPELAWLFAGNSRAEVPFLVNARRNGAPVRLAGRFDRLIVDADTVTVVDYKSDANPPATPEAVQNAYLAQLGLYALVAGQLFPQHSVKAAVLWTRLESLMFLPKSLLAEAVSAFTVE
jgi:ATP-dependent helicase/nuclease subunit A